MDKEYTTIMDTKTHCFGAQPPTVHNCSVMTKFDAKLFSSDYWLVSLVTSLMNIMMLAQLNLCV